jgi:hypothetical protein
MGEKLRRISAKDLSPKKSLSQGKYFSLDANKILLFIALGSRLIICPGDDILAVTASTVTGISTSDTPRDAVLPKPTKIILKEENKNRDKNKA